MAKREGLPKSAIKRLMKKGSGNARISAKAVELAKLELEDKAKCMGASGLMYANRAKRKGVNRDDIKVVISYEQCGSEVKRVSYSAPAPVPKVVPKVEPVKEVTKPVKEKKTKKTKATAKATT